MTTRVQPSTISPPILPDDVWCGWLARYRDWVEPTTDGAMEAIFAGGSQAVGIAIGREVAVQYGRETYGNLYLNLVGKTGVPRKTTIVSRQLRVLERAFTADFLVVTRSVGSGEGLLELFMNEEPDPKKKGGLVAIPRRRVLLDEPEFTGLLKKTRRSGTANLVEILLGLFDGDDFTPRTRARPLRVIEPFFNVITTTTPENLEMNLLEEDILSGLIPRFANFWCTPRPANAYPDAPDPALETSLAADLVDIFKHAQALAKVTPVVTLSAPARREWESSYRAFTDIQREAPSAAAAIMTRVPLYTMKFALNYMVLTGHSQVETDDLARATLVGAYLMETAQMVPFMARKSRVARVEAKVVESLKVAHGQWLTTSQLHQLVGGRIKAEELRRSLEALARLGVIEEGVVPGRTRDITAYRVG